MSSTSKPTFQNNLSPEQLAPLNDFTRGLISKLSSDITFHTKKDIDLWREEFEQFRNTIVTSAHPNAKNYSERYFNLEHQTEITIVKDSGRIVTFSSLQEKEIYPNSSARILNRTWKQPYQNRMLSAGYVRIMAALQIAAAQEKGLKLVFCTMQEKREQWWKGWQRYGNEIYPGWITYPGMVKVCDGPTLNCWQSMAYLALQPNVGPDGFASISFEQWQKQVDVEQNQVIE